ncbi:MAG: two-component sensor histidine kinase [Alphaproteobacteria bacterium HGW-Alphaproteobacteria-1]|jgi:two-component system osmolarity sensor histidine kinase EnvZ|nr:MAG: two-component sensor histidine kinase [Alphaproteobacteria bacterium HGW-Alphaproteobacteria-1]
MMLRWLKPYLPRGLFGRTVLSLLVPVVTLLLVVSVVFVQRHFEGVTEQMVATVAREIRVVRDTGDADLATALGITMQPVPHEALPDRDSRRWFDFSGIVIIKEMHALFPDLARVVLRNDRDVTLYFPAGSGFVEMTLWRAHVSARRPHLLFVNLMAAGGLMTLISFLYLRAQLRPMTRLAAAAEAFGRGGHVPYRPSGATEVRAAGRAFLEMRARIERQIEQRTLMLSGVSHDMRTPLTRLRLGLAMIDEAEAEPMLRDVDDMQRLLDGFLDFARGAQESAPEPVDPVALVQQVVADMQRAAVDVALHEVEGTGEVALRPHAVRRAVENLIANAVRYGTRAEVSVWLGPKTLRIRVEDDGPGIPPERREEALRPFTRLEPARNQNRGTGVGLGLSIVIDVARAHGGTLRLGESARMGGLSADIVIAR